MTRSRPLRPSALSAFVSAVVIAILVTVPVGAVLAADDTAKPFKGKTPKQMKGVDLTWYPDPAESQLEGSTRRAFGDIVAVGIAIEQGNTKVRQRLIKQAGQKGTTHGPATKTGENDTVVHLVANLKGKVPAKKWDVVLVAGGDGADAVAYSAADRESLTQGAAFAHVIGHYGSLKGAPWRTGDDTVKGDASGTPIDFELPGTGAGGWDPKTKSIYTSFILPSGTQNLSVSVYTAEDGTVQTDLLSGPGHTYRVPVGPSAAPFTCAKIDAFARYDSGGSPTGVYDVRATLVEPINGVAPSSPHSLAFEANPGPGAATAEVLPESPPGSANTYWQGTADTGSPDGGIIDINTPGSWGTNPGEPAPAALNAFGGVRILGSPDGGGTVFGDPLCGTVFHMEGCANGGGADFWRDFVEAAGQPRPTGEIQEFPYAGPLGTGYCVVAEEGVEQPYALFGIEPHPYTFPGHVHDMEANPCPQRPVDIGPGGVEAACHDGPTTYRWFDNGLDPADPGAKTGWGVRPALTILPNGLEVLGSTGGFDAPPEALERARIEGRHMMSGAGFNGGEGGYDFSNEATTEDTSDDLIAD